MSQESIQYSLKKKISQFQEYLLLTGKSRAFITYQQFTCLSIKIIILICFHETHIAYKIMSLRALEIIILALALAVPARTHIYSHWIQRENASEVITHSHTTEKMVTDKILTRPWTINILCAMWMLSYNILNYFCFQEMTLSIEGAFQFQQSLLSENSFSFFQ